MLDGSDGAPFENRRVRRQVPARMAKHRPSRGFASMIRADPFANGVPETMVASLSDSGKNGMLRPFSSLIIHSKIFVKFSV
jgi:hypothetical protein